MTIRLIQRVHANDRGRGHVDWYSSPGEEAAGFPIMTASPRGVSYSPAVNPGQLPAEARALAEAVAAGLAADPRATLFRVLHRALRNNRRSTGDA